MSKIEEGIFQFLMADKLIYKGGANVVGQTGSEMKLVLPKAGDIHSFPRWWNKKGTVAYVDCAIFDVTIASGQVVKLVIPITGYALINE